MSADWLRRWTRGGRLAAPPFLFVFDVWADSYSIYQQQDPDGKPYNDMKNAKFGLV